MKKSVAIVCVALMSGCQTWYVETGPIYDMGDNADNGDVPWEFEVGARVTPHCKLGAKHISSVLAGKPFSPGRQDAYAVSGAVMKCSMGPGR